LDFSFYLAWNFGLSHVLQWSGAMEVVPLLEIEQLSLHQLMPQNGERR
jgi:hypothetical protein